MDIYIITPMHNINMLCTADCCHLKVLGKNGHEFLYGVEEDQILKKIKMLLK